MMIRITDTPKPRDRFGSIPIREGKPTNSSLYGPHLPRQHRKSFLWNWLKKTIIFFLGLTLLLGLASPLLVPYLTTTLLPAKMAAALNRSVTIARAEFNPLTCTLTLHHLIVGPDLSTPKDPVDPLLSAGSISISFAPNRLLDGEFAYNLGAEHFFLHLIRQKDGGYNLGQALNNLLPTMPALPLRFFCNAVTVSNSRLVFDDDQTGKTHLVEEISLTIPPGQRNPLTLQALINGAPITFPAATNLNAGQAPTGPNPIPEQSSTEPEGDASVAPATPDDSAVKTAEAITLIQDLTQAARQYLQTPATPALERRTLPLAP